MRQTRPVPALCIDSGVARPVEDALALEAPLAILVNGIPFSVTMRTPGDDRALARGLRMSAHRVGPGRVQECEHIAHGRLEIAHQVLVADLAVGKRQAIPPIQP